MRTKLEARIDAEFKHRGIKPHVYHFNDHSHKEGGNPHRIWAFGGVTIATLNPNYEEVETMVLEEQRTCGIFYSAAKDTLAGLRKQGIHGVSICDNRDQFSRKRGRIIAKGRLLKYLKEGDAKELILQVPPHQTLIEGSIRSDGCFQCGMSFKVGDPVYLIVARLEYAYGGMHLQMHAMPICATCAKRISK